MIKYLYCISEKECRLLSDYWLLCIKWCARNGATARFSKRFFSFNIHSLLLFDAFHFLFSIHSNTTETATTTSTKRIKLLFYYVRIWYILTYEIFDMLGLIEPFQAESIASLFFRFVQSPCFFLVILNEHEWNCDDFLCLEKCSKTSRFIHVQYINMLYIEIRGKCSPLSFPWYDSI